MTKSNIYVTKFLITMARNVPGSPVHAIAHV